MSSSCYALPNDVHFPNETYILPDPFKFLDGKHVTDKASWSCRAAQLRELFQRFELGYKPPRPPILTSSMNGTILTITAGFENKTVEFPINITYPSNGTKPYPAVISFSGGLGAIAVPSVPIPAGAASILLDNSKIAAQSGAATRGKGIFFDLYGNSSDPTTPGSMMAWAWAVSRIVDVLEASPEISIDATKLAITGCSRNGKGALVAGAFDERLALTIAQESGSGGDACWRTSRAMYVDRNLLTQTAQEIVLENDWFSVAFDVFAATNYSIGTLPFDHHELAGLVAPRGLYSTGNVEFLWLGGWTNWECMLAANRIFKALGVGGRQGFSQDGPHDHCSFPADQVGEINAFYDRFLFDKDVETGVFRTVGNWTFNETWVPWKTPQLY